MKKCILALAMGSTLAITAGFANADNGNPLAEADSTHARDAALQWRQSPLPDATSRAVSVLEAAQVRGRVLPFVIGVAAIDIALASFYWGVYVPEYAGQEPAFVPL